MFSVPMPVNWPLTHCIHAPLNSRLFAVVSAVATLAHEVSNVIDNNKAWNNALLHALFECILFVLNVILGFDLCDL